MELGKRDPYNIAPTHRKFAKVKASGSDSSGKGIMDQKEFWKEIEKALNQGFEAAKTSAKFVSKKAGEAARITKLLAEKFKLEHQIGKKFAELGHKIYDRAVRENIRPEGMDKEVDHLIEEARVLDEKLNSVESKLEDERRKAKG